MSKNPKSERTFNYTPTQTLTALNTIKTEWDLKSLYYKSEKDPRIEADIQTTETAFTAFAKKWRTKSFTETPELLAKALTEYEKLSSMPEASRPGRYFGLRASLDVNDTVAQKQSALLSKRLRKVTDQIIFFNLTIGKIPRANQKAFLKHPKLAPFRYHLERIFLESAHDLTEAEEKIISLKSRQSHGMWVNATEKIISNRTVVWGGKEVAIPEALEMIDMLPSAQKPELWSLILTEIEQIGEYAEHEFNAIITDVRNEDELRGYAKPYSATALSYEDTEASIENLVSAVSTKGFALSKKFYKLKAAYHGVDALHYAQKYDSIGEAKDIPFEQSVDICRDVFYSLKPCYGEIFDTMLTNGQIDVYPRKGKRGGAFMSAQTNQPTHVFLNHTSNFKSLETLAHEMGHAIHAERSKTQPVIYDDHSITTAETASTLFENFIFDAVYAQAAPDEQAILLHDRITRDIATIQRQIAFFNCEFEIHNTIFEKGAMTNDELRTCMLKHLKSYLGPAITLTEKDGYSYVYVPHLRYGFYVYTYSFGILMSTIMANKYKADNNYIEEIDRFLTAGRSENVATIFRSIGIETETPDTFVNALGELEKDINAFAKFVRKKK